ncbi:hypothetical protein [Streptacidiphilus carbonis]|uniref:hypothetical protein n=1 Tax=Streptacidiphilus carbonis TaxID=105422 RepID=UPI000693EDF2|nr:hypothetical protein [Streptacidiphilus carbonis]
MNLRRPSNDELTPEDLFRPEPAGGTSGGQQPGPAMPGEVIRSSPDGLPWNAPTQAQPDGNPEYYGEPSYGEQGYGEQGYGRQAAPEQEASTQFIVPMPSYPGVQPQQPQQPHQQPTYGNGYPQQGYQQGGYDQGGGYGAPAPGYDQGGYDERPATRRFSTRAIGIAVVAGCAVLGIAVAAALGGGSSKGAAAVGSTTSVSASAGASSGATSASAAQTQAKAMSDLLATASHSRAAVISAVGDITNCRNLDQAKQNLTTAAGLREQLVSQLGSMQTDQLKNGAALVAALQEGWKASESADSHYAAWAAESKGSCAHDHRPKAGGRNAADAASGTASTAKEKASKLWNAIAAETGQPKLSATQL